MLKRISVLILILFFGMALAGRFSFVCARAQERRKESRPRQAQPPPSAEATVILNEQFLNSFLEAIYTNLRAPSYQISIVGLTPPKDRQPILQDGQAVRDESVSSSHANAQGECASVIVLEREMGGVRTAVHFEQGRIAAPLAFSGSYSAGLLGCIKFEGWAETVMNLEFDRERQVLSARVKVQDIHLNNVPTLASGPLVTLVQNAIDSRLNPVELLQAAQLSARVPVAASGGALRLRAREVRPEVVPGSLRLHIIYEFVKAD
ncbi:MAG TPA: hypothetical protein VGB17_14300 [Pyrinomonadaceae bacterium]|jgi:hypothetical protein